MGTAVAENESVAEALKWFELQAKGYRQAAMDEATLEARRPVEKLEAIKRIMEAPNPLTEKAHSYSSAEAMVETDREYAGFLAGLREATYNRRAFEAQMESARLRARAAVAMIGGAA